MYFPYLRGRQFELIALRELVENDRINNKIIPVIEPIKPSSTLLKTLQTFINKEKEITIILNPNVGDFRSKLEEMMNEGSKIACDLSKLIMNNPFVIKSFIMKAELESEIKHQQDKHEYIIINDNRDNLTSYMNIYDECSPRYTLIPDDRACKRIVLSDKILFEDVFKKQPRNIDYIKNLDEFFSDSHLYYRNDNFDGFSDYSIVGKEFNESGFAPIAVAIHLVYFDSEKVLRIHHFVSDSNDGIEDPAGKFGEALHKLVKWCEQNNIKETLGLRGLFECYRNGKYPGLGMVKKYSIMHHIELVSDYLGGVD